MRNALLATVCFGVFALVGCQTESSGAGASGAAHKDYGDPIASLDQLTPIPDIVSRPAEFDGKTVTVKGVIASVCPSSGCFLHLGAGSTQIEVDLKEKGFTIPPGRGVGQIAYAMGVVRAGARSVKIAAHGLRILEK